MSSFKPKTPSNNALRFQRTKRFGIGTLNSILRAVARHKTITKDEILKLL